MRQRRPALASPPAPEHRARGRRARRFRARRFRSAECSSDDHDGVGRATASVSGGELLPWGAAPIKNARKERSQAADIELMKHLLAYSVASSLVAFAAAAWALLRRAPHAPR